MSVPTVDVQPDSTLPSPGTISLARGIPAPETFPEADLLESTRTAIERHGAVALNYGEPEGFRPLREWLAARHGVAAERVLVTPGSIVALSFIVRALLERVPRAATEVPCYDRMVSLLRRTGAEIVTVPRTASGLEPAAIRRLVDGGSPPAFLYVMPTFHNPTGLTMTLEEREQLADLAVECELVLIEDDPYGPLRFDGEPLPQLQQLLRERGADHLVVHLSSFSKTVAPGLRVGYTVAPESLIGRLRELALTTYTSPPMFAQAQLYEYVNAGLLDGHVEELRTFLRARRDALLEGLEQHMPSEVTWTRPDGGYFLWLGLPASVQAGALAERAAAAGVTIVPGEGCFPGAGGEHGARLSFSFPDPDQIRTATARLGGLVREQLAP